MDHLRGTVYDPTEQLLIVYAKTDDGTVGNLMQSLLDLELLPALHNAVKHVDDFLAEIKNGKTRLITLPIKTPNEEAKDITKAADYESSGLPLIFDPAPKIKLGPLVTRRETVENQQAASYSQGRPHQQQCHYSKRVMLTFASDGLAAAQKIAAVLRSTRNKKGLPMGVLMLHENESAIQENPVQTITCLISQMDFVVPVLTEGYFAALDQPNDQSRLLDERYAGFIFDIFMSKYIHDNCVNRHVRPIIPSTLYDRVREKQEFVHNPIFNSWKTDEELPALARCFLKSSRNKISLQ